jgi:hypothetical protein
MPTGTATGATTGTGTTFCATWHTIKVSHRPGLGFCVTDGTAASVMVKQGEDGSFTLSGEAFRKAPGETDGCYFGYLESCMKKQAFSETKLTPTERDRLISLVAAMPPGKCTANGNCDPCIITTLTIDDFSDEDWEGCCLEASGPETHLAGEHAIVAFIDSLVPGNVAVGVDASAGDARRDSRPDR